jgi:uncharacterized phage-like protein YoqJ
MADDKYSELKNKTIKSFEKIDAKWIANNGNSYTKPASIEIVFTDGTKCKKISLKMITNNNKLY